jgi:cell division protein FtsB
MKRLRNGSPYEVDLGWMGALNRAIRWCLFIGIIGFIIAQYLPLIRKNQALRENLARWEAQQARLAGQADDTTARLQSLREDPRAVERAARERLQLARTNESVINFISPGAPAP